MIELTDVTKRYGSVTALTNVNLKVNQGEVFGLLGPNGAGKSTTLRLVAGLAQPTRGLVRVAGLDPWQEGQSIRRQVGVMMDGAVLYDGLTVRENLLLFAGLYGLGAQPAEAALEQMGVANLQQRMASQLSKGQRQRVALARSILHQPRLLFLDEPTSGLDPVASAELHDHIRRLCAQGVTILLSSHDMAEVDELCSRVCLLDRGRMLACETPAALKRSHGPTLTDAFIHLTRGAR